MNEGYEFKEATMANNWTEICAKCKEGDIEPRYCEYYGEPNGCNSPTYGEHPPTSNAAAMREALDQLYEQICYGETEQNVVANRQMIRAALAAPPRNCDVGTAEEQVKRFMRYCNSRVCNRRDCACGYEELFRHKCALKWAQMPYKSAKRN